MEDESQSPFIVYDVACIEGYCGVEDCSDCEDLNQYEDMSLGSEEEGSTPSDDPEDESWEE